MQKTVIAAAGALFLAGLVLSPPLAAQSVGKVGFVDMQKALNESQAGKKALETMKNMMEEKKADLQKTKEVIEQKKDELDKQGLLLNEEIRREREEEIRRLERNHKRKLADSKEELARQEARFTDSIRRGLLEIIGKLGRDEGYTLVLEKQFSAILYAPDSIDLTDEIVKRYNAGTQP